MRNAAEAPAATTKPTAAPASASTAVSVNIWTATNHRDAPSDRRTEISCRRCAARDKSKAAMFVEAISNSTETAPNNSHNDPRTPPTVVSLSGTTWTPTSRSVSGCCSVSRA